MSRIFARLAAVTAGLIAPAVLATAALAGTCPSQSNGPDFGPAVGDWHPGLHSPYTYGTFGHGTFTFGSGHGTFTFGSGHGTEHGTGHGTNHGTGHGTNHGTGHGTEHGTGHGTNHGTGHGTNHGTGH